jgi:hypothetical protein
MKKSFGLDSSNVLLEKFPLLINPQQVKITRVPYRSVTDDE